MVMNEFESTLASALQAEADRTTLHLDTADAANLLEAGLDRIDRDRRHRTWAAVLAAAAAVLVAGAVYMNTDSPISIQPAGTPSTTSTSPSAGTPNYQMPVSYAKGVLLQAGVTLDLTLDGAWRIDNYPWLHDAGKYGGLAVYRPSALAAGTGCLTDRPNTNVGRTPQLLAQQLARLPRSTLLQPPTPTQKLGRQAIHLQLRINPNCGTGVYRVAQTLLGGHGISYGRASAHVVIDFWVENVRGVPLVIETWHQDGASSHMVNEIARAVNTLTFTNGG
jgi:hypothetical protein